MSFYPADLLAFKVYFLTWTLQWRQLYEQGKVD